MGAEPRRKSRHALRFMEAPHVLTGGNLGPGQRFFGFAPGISRQEVGDWRPPIVREYVTKRLATKAMIAYFIELRPPGDDYYEAYVNPQVDEILHEGSTWGTKEPSSAFYYDTGPLEVGTFPSILDKPI